MIANPFQDDDTPATTTTAATTTTTTTTTATTTGVGVSPVDPDTPSPASEDEQVMVVPAIKVPRKPRTTKHTPMKPGAAIDTVSCVLILFKRKAGIVVIKF